LKAWKTTNPLERLGSKPSLYMVAAVNPREVLGKNTCYELV